MMDDTQFFMEMENPPFSTTTQERLASSPQGGAPSPSARALSNLSTALLQPTQQAPTFHSTNTTSTTAHSNHNYFPSASSSSSSSSPCKTETPRKQEESDDDLMGSLEEDGSSIGSGTKRSLQVNTPSKQPQGSNSDRKVRGATFDDSFLFSAHRSPTSPASSKLINLSTTSANNDHDSAPGQRNRAKVSSSSSSSFEDDDPSSTSTTSATAADKPVNYYQLKMKYLRSLNFDQQEIEKKQREQHRQRSQTISFPMMMTTAKPVPIPIPIPSATTTSSSSSSHNNNNNNANKTSGTSATSSQSSRRRSNYGNNVEGEEDLSSANSSAEMEPQFIPPHMVPKEETFSVWQYERKKVVARDAV
ncbi:hypothetical protein QOT17_014704 [Balamuthia mandrillaris]